jgi:integrase
MQNDIIQKNYVPFLKYEKKDEKHHTPFTTEEIETLWKDINKYKLILIYIYTGCRANELLALKKADVNLDEKCFNIIKSKTNAGIRTVPIADKIFPFFEFYYYESNTDDVFDGIDYPQLATFYRDNIPNHTAHDTRSTFVSLATAKKIDERVIQKIVGHSGGNITRDVYTKLEISTLREAVNQL